MIFGEGGHDGFTQKKAGCGCSEARFHQAAARYRGVGLCGASMAFE
jgi:hypothetical protein